MDGAQAEIALQGFEGFLDLRELDVELSELGGVASGEVAAQ